MKYFEYLYYRLYEAYDKKSDSPAIKSSLYIALLLFVIIILLLVFLERFLLMAKVYPENEIDSIKQSWILWAIIFVLLLGMTYVRFTKKSPSYYKERFSEWCGLNKSIKVWMILNFPFVLLFPGLIINVFLFGGVLFGKVIRGVFDS